MHDLGTHDATIERIQELIPCADRRRVLALYLFDGLTQQQIADQENTPRRTIAHRLAKMQKTLEDAGLPAQRFTGASERPTYSDGSTQMVGTRRFHKTSVLLSVDPTVLDRLTMSDDQGDGRPRYCWKDSDKTERRE